MASNSLRSSIKCKVASSNLCKWLTTVAAEEGEEDHTSNKEVEVVVMDHRTLTSLECLPHR